MFLTNLRVVVYFVVYFVCFHRGLVTYREVDLLIDPVKGSSQQKQRVATVVTHELAHQVCLYDLCVWQGDLCVCSIQCQTRCWLTFSLSRLAYLFLSFCARLVVW